MSPQNVKNTLDGFGKMESIRSVTSSSVPNGLDTCWEAMQQSSEQVHHQNDRVWARSIDEIEDDERFRQMSAKPSCIGVFICFTAKGMIWVLKDQGVTWDGPYFRETILIQNLIPFLKIPDNVVSVPDVCFLHDKAPCFKALATQQMLKDSQIDFFDNTQWPGNSPDLNPTENLGAIFKDSVESRLHDVGAGSVEALRQALTAELQIMAEDLDLFRRLLHSFSARIKAVFPKPSRVFFTFCGGLHYNGYCVRCVCRNLIKLWVFSTY